ncbi:nitrate reductase molybdenum cofactor assembly chaperone [Streptomyces sp. YC504]|uniref:Nitrate reductase molybdenum cofactor assembly chaperone n=1 Tax=Streptomyces mesophilus TaxID=1775132 RepID=A0A6G4XTB1_9ACTN|nr:nitrate reductase molybdenum cofactor assembly chaperone [Streptomyces mesophilus]NGO80047.1 nitrate reductase molybdenum cofactor assembly chaperone [Streptomyces mesophilus]
MTPDALVRLVAGRLLQYPDARLHEELPRFEAALTGAAPEPARLLAEFLAYARVTPELELAAHYGDVFDTRNRRCLYLTWWTDGDTRNRGLSLVRMKRIYRDFGLEFASDELPDFLPVALEFAALHPEAGTLLLEEHRAGLELLRLAVTAADTPYARVLEAVCATLPGPSPETKAEAKALAKRGPKHESVGLSDPLEPFGPGVELPWPTTRLETPERPVTPERTPA